MKKNILKAIIACMASAAMLLSAGCSNSSPAPVQNGQAPLTSGSNANPISLTTPTTSTAPTTPTTPTNQSSSAVGTYKMGISQEAMAALSAEQQAQMQQILNTSTLTLNADGTATATSMGQTGTGTWSMAGNDITISVQGSTTNGVYENGLIYDPNDRSTYFQKIS